MPTFYEQPAGLLHYFSDMDKMNNPKWGVPTTDILF
jgi:hypothetical protein